MVCYALQIYFDFSGYSDMAIGLARMFGFRFPENFNHALSRRTSITDFWRRWHITLSRWFRDYVYIPLGGNRRLAAGAPRQSVDRVPAVRRVARRELNFMVWGMSARPVPVDRTHRRRHALVTSLPELLGMDCLRYVDRLIGWVFFRQTSLDLALETLAAMFVLVAPAMNVMLVRRKLRRRSWC